MSRFPFILIVLVLLAIFSSCNPVVRMAYGIKKPKVESETSLRKYLDKKDIPDDNIYTVSSDDFKQVVSLNNNKIPEMMVFNSEGKMIVYREDATCNAGAPAFIDSLNTNRIYPHSERTTLSNEWDRLRFFDGSPASVKYPDSADFVILIYWARYMGRLNKTQVKEWELRARQNNSAKIEVVKINLDLQEFWENEE